MDSVTSYNYTEFTDLARLRKASADNPEKSLEAVAHQFEALFTQMLFKSMRNAELSSGLFDNNQTKMYQDLLDKQLSTNLSSQTGLGIADVLVRQLSKNRQMTVQQSEAAGAAAASFSNGHQNQRVSAGEGRPSDVFADRNEFIAKLGPIAEKLERQYQIPSRSLLAQSALETGWGKHMIQNSDGSNSHNLFGIKAGPDWHGKVAVSRTIEFIDGIPVNRNEPFRSYDSFEDSMRDYADYIASHRRYESAYQQRSDPDRYFTELQLAGYATDPSYASKINGIIDRLEETA